MYARVLNGVVTNLVDFEPDPDAVAAASGGQQGVLTFVEAPPGLGVAAAWTWDGTAFAAAATVTAATSPLPAASTDRGAAPLPAWMTP